MRMESLEHVNAFLFYIILSTTVSFVDIKDAILFLQSGESGGGCWAGVAEQRSLVHSLVYRYCAAFKSAIIQTSATPIAYY